MAVTGWILVQAQVGRARAVADGIAAIEAPGVRILSSETVTGPHDVIVRMQADDLDRLNDCVDGAIGAIPGIVDTITCLAIRVD